MTTPRFKCDGVKTLLLQYILTCTIPTNTELDMLLARSFYITQGDWREKNSFWIELREIGVCLSSLLVGLTFIVPGSGNSKNLLIFPGRASYSFLFSIFFFNIPIKPLANFMKISFVLFIWSSNCLIWSSWLATSVSTILSNYSWHGLSGNVYSPTRSTILQKPSLLLSIDISTLSNCSTCFSILPNICSRVTFM